MANHCVQAAGEALPIALDPITDAPATGGDQELLFAIRSYRAGLIACSQLSDEDYGKVKTYEPWQVVLDNWDKPARTREGALEALRMALGDEDGVYECEAADRMVQAAISYLEAAQPKDCDVALLALIEQYREAMKLDLAAWDKVADIEETEAMAALPIVCVQISTFRKGYDDEGKPVEVPIYAYSAAEVRAKLDKRFHDSLSFAFPRSGGHRDRAIAENEARIQSLIVELETLQAFVARGQDESGYTEALEIAKATSEAVKKIVRLIVSHVPRSIEEAALLASWVLAARKEDCNHLEDEDFALVLGSIAAAAPAVQGAAA